MDWGWLTALGTLLNATNGLRPESNWSTGKKPFESGFYVSGADGQLSPKLTFRLKVGNGAGCASAMQRLTTFVTGSYLAVQL
jgi:hypothetical protein